MRRRASKHARVLASYESERKLRGVLSGECLSRALFAVRCASEPYWAWAEWTVEKTLLPAGVRAAHTLLTIRGVVPIAALPRCCANLKSASACCFVRTDWVAFSAFALTFGYATLCVSITCVSINVLARLRAQVKPKTVAEVTNAEILQTLQKTCRQESGGSPRPESPACTAHRVLQHPHSST